MKTLKSLNRVTPPLSQRQQLRFGKPGAGKHAGGHMAPKERNRK